jgi:hypothetical protein
MKDDPLAQLTQKLSLSSGPSRTTWPRLGPKGDLQLPGRPANHLSQLSEWVLAPDAGLKKTPLGDEEDEDTGGGKGKRRRPNQTGVSKRKQNRKDG